MASAGVVGSRGTVKGGTMASAGVVGTRGTLKGGLMQSVGGSVIIDGYALYLLIGQSNMAGRGVFNASIDTTDPKVFQFGSRSSDSATYRQITVGVDPLKHPETSLTAVGAGMSLAKNTSAASGNDSILIPCAWGNTGTVSGSQPWFPTVTDPGGSPSPNTPGSLHWFAIRQANAAIAAAQAVRPGSRLVAIFDLQGEADSDGVVTQAQYMQAKFDAYAAMRANITGAAGVPVIIGQMVPEATTVLNAWATIDNAHTAIAASVARATKVAVGSGLANGDNLHYSALGLRGTDGKGGMGLAFFNGIATAQGSAGDTTVPNAPTVAAGTPASGSVPLIVTAPSGGGAARIYEFQYARASTPTVFTAGTPSASTSNNALVGLSPSTAYIVQARAKNAFGVGPWSASASFTTAAGGGTSDVFPNLTSLDSANITRSGDATNGYSFTQAASTNGIAAVSTHALPAGIDCTFSAPMTGTYASGSYPVLSVQRANVSKGWSSSNGSDYSILPHPAGAYRVSNGVGTWGYVTINGATVAPQSGDILRWRKTADNQLVAEVARAGAPTTFTAIHTFTGIVDTLYGQLTLINNVGATPLVVGPLRMTNAVAA